MLIVGPKSGNVLPALGEDNEVNGFQTFLVVPDDEVSSSLPTFFADLSIPLPTSVQLSFLVFRQLFLSYVSPLVGLCCDGVLFFSCTFCL